MMKTYLLMMRKAVLIGSIFLLFFATSAIGATHYVAPLPAGSDSNPGTKASPWRTIQKAADTVNAGDTVIVKDGTYTGSGYAVVEVKCAGTAHNWITFRAENLHGAVVDGTTDRHGWNFGKSAKYIRIEGFEVIWCVVGFRANNPAHHIYIYKNKIHNIGRWIQKTCTAGNPATGIFSGMHTSYWTIDSNLIYDIGRKHNPACDSDYRWDHNIYSCGHHQVIKNNIIYNNYAGYCIKLTSHCDSIHSDANTHIITNNTFAFDANPVDFTGISHIRLYHDAYNKPKNVVIQNNIFYNPPNNRAILQKGSWFTGTTIRNNLCTGKIHTESSNPPVYTNNRENMDPLLTDPNKFDFTLQNNSPAIDAGTASQAPDLDCAVMARPQQVTYDIGAYEHIPQDYLPATPENLRLIP